jgi:collagenase-like PrtC family protease
MQKLIVPTIWDDGLVTEYKALGITECYGKLSVDCVGGGRAGFILPYAGRRRVELHVRRLHNAGIKFNYLLNAACSGFREFTRSGDSEIRRLLDWLKRIEADSVTVSSPYLLRLIKERRPEIKVGVSTNAEVNSLQRALFWERLGADNITLSHTSLNRNFPMLRLIRRNTSCELRLIANSSCLFNCPFFRYHSSFDAHASQSDFISKAGFAVDYCNIFCKFIRLSDPSAFITSQWIRPEDLGVYEEAGINGIKLIDRRSSRHRLLQICRSYAARSYDGNLADLLPTFQCGSPLNQKTLLLKSRVFLHPAEFNIFKLKELRALAQDMGVYIDNRKLDGFIRAFIHGDCSLKDCTACGHCKQTADKALHYDPARLEEMRERYGKFLGDFAGGRMFYYTGSGKGGCGR